MISRWHTRSKLVALLTAPLLALTAVGGILVTDRLDAARRAGEVRDLVEVAAAVSPAVENLQKERSLVGVRLFDHESAAVESQYELQSRNTDIAIEAFVGEARSLGIRLGSSSLDAGVKDVLAQAEALKTLRGRVDRNVVEPTAALSDYTAAIDAFLGISDRLALRADDPALAARVTAYRSIAGAEEEAAQQTAILATAFGSGVLETDVLAAAVDSRTTENLHLAAFRQVANAGQAGALDEVFQNNSVKLVGRLRDAAIADPAEVEAASDIFRGSSTVKVKRLGELRETLRTELLATAEGLAADSRSEALGFAVGGIGLLVVTIILGMLLARSIVRPIKRLTRAASGVATSLPSVVAAMAKPDGAEQASLPDTIKVGGGEMGDLAEAFNEVHRVAVKVAGEQAALRAGIADMFVNLARRNQALLERQLSFIDALEREEHDPDTLENLFQLDHLSTRMRRNAESLLILAGTDPVRGWRQPVQLKDVVRAAASEVEDYKRIRVPDTDQISIPGPVAAGLVHLLAELLENATRFSSPEHAVDVRVNHFGETITVTVHDRGIGMSDEALALANEKLSAPPLVDATISRHLGLFVVGRIAWRLGLSIGLGRSAWGGVSAQVVIPARLLVAAPGPSERRSAAPGPVGTAPAPSGALPTAPSTTNGQTASGLARRAPASAAPAADVANAAPIPAAAPAEVKVEDAPAAAPAVAASPALVSRAARESAPAAPVPAAATEQRTSAGLAKRMPRAVQPAPGAAPSRPLPGADGPGANPNPLTPERVQSALSSFQSGMLRGRAKVETPASTDTTENDNG